MFNFNHRSTHSLFRLCVGRECRQSCVAYWICWTLVSTFWTFRGTVDTSLFYCIGKKVKRLNQLDCVIVDNVQRLCKLYLYSLCHITYTLTLYNNSNIECNFQVNCVVLNTPNSIVRETRLMEKRMNKFGISRVVGSKAQNIYTYIYNSWTSTFVDSTVSRCSYGIDTYSISVSVCRSWVATWINRIAQRLEY